MADNYDRYENEGGGGFMMGLLTGTVLGAGLGMLLAPKAGSELRGALGEQARNWGNAASEQYRTARDAAGGWAERGRDLAERGRDMVNQARDVATQAAEQARGYAGAATGSSYGSTGSGTSATTGSSTGTTGSSFSGSGSSATDRTRS